MDLMDSALKRRTAALAAAAVVAGTIVFFVGTAGSAGTNSGVATYDDYVRAAERTVECIHDKGANGSYVESEKKTISIFIAASATVSDPDALDRIYTECSDEHLSETEANYLAATQPSEAEHQAIVNACLVDLGLITESSSAADIDRVLSGHLRDDDPLGPQIADCLTSDGTPSP